MRSRKPRSSNTLWNRSTSLWKLPLIFRLKLLGRVIVPTRTVAIAFLLCMIIFSTLGFFGAYIYFPKKEMVTIEVASPEEKKTDIPTKKDLPKPKITQAQINWIGEMKVTSLMENCRGFLGIKGNQATTIRYKQASIASKSGFTDLVIGTSYRIIAYHYDGAEGIGIARFDEDSIFFFKWIPDGNMKPPTQNPGTICRVQGTKIESGIQ